MNLDVTIRAIGVLRIQVVLWTCGLFRADTMGHAVTRQTELGYAARNQQARVRRTMRRMTGDAPIRLDRSMFVNEGALLVCVTLNASRVDARRQSRLLEFKATVRIVAIAALHRSFQHFVMERQIELVLGFTVTTEAKLRFAVP